MSPSPAHAVVWAEIPVTDLDAARAFYGAVTGHELSPDEAGPNPVAFFAVADGAAGIGGHLYPGTPAPGTGNTVHIAVDGPLEDAAERCRAAGGQVVSDPIAIPAGRFVYATDLDGNSIGLFEAAG